MRKEPYRLSSYAIISLFISLMLSAFLISTMIKNKIEVENMFIEQLILEKSFQINQAVSKLVYKTGALSAIITQGKGDIYDIDRLAAEIVDDPVIRFVYLAPNGYISKVYPLEGNEELLGYYLLGNDPGNKEAKIARDSNRIVFAGPYEAPHGGTVLSGRMSIYIDTPEGKKFWGLVSITLKYPEILDYGELETFNEHGLAYELWRINPDTNKKQVISGNLDRIKQKSRIIRRQMDFFDAHWFFDVSPSHEWYQQPENMVLIMAGLLICFSIMFIVQNNSELKNMKSTLELLTNTDVLTGIYNRRYMDDHIKTIVKATSRSGSILSILMIDVDLFKNYNDTYGHSKGDSCLKTIARILSQSLSREDDFAARYGGEEFTVILPYTDENGARIIANRLLENIRNSNIPHVSSSVAQCVTISIGITSGKAKYTNTGNEFIKKADEALYESKHSGRNKYTFIAFED